MEEVINSSSNFKTKNKNVSSKKKMKKYSRIKIDQEILLKLQQGLNEDNDTEPNTVISIPHFNNVPIHNSSKTKIVTSDSIGDLHAVGKKAISNVIPQSKIKRRKSIIQDGMFHDKSKGIKKENFLPSNDHESSNLKSENDIEHVSVTTCYNLENYKCNNQGLNDTNESEVNCYQIDYTSPNSQNCRESCKNVINNIRSQRPPTPIPPQDYNNKYLSEAINGNFYEENGTSMPHRNCALVIETHGANVKSNNVQCIIHNDQHIDDMSVNDAIIKRSYFNGRDQDFDTYEDYDKNKQICGDFISVNRNCELFGHPKLLNEDKKDYNSNNNRIHYFSITNDDDHPKSKFEGHNSSKTKKRKKKKRRYKSITEFVYPEKLNDELSNHGNNISSGNSSSLVLFNQVQSKQIINIGDYQHESLDNNLTVENKDSSDFYDNSIVSVKSVGNEVNSFSGAQSHHVSNNNNIITNNANGNSDNNDLSMSTNRCPSSELTTNSKLHNIEDISAFSLNESDQHWAMNRMLLVHHENQHDISINNSYICKQSCEFENHEGNLSDSITQFENQFSQCNPGKTSLSIKTGIYVPLESESIIEAVRNDSFTKLNCSTGSVNNCGQFIIDNDNYLKESYDNEYFSNNLAHNACDSLDLVHFDLCKRTLHNKKLALNKIIQKDHEFKIDSCNDLGFFEVNDVTRQNTLNFYEGFEFEKKDFKKDILFCKFNNENKINDIECKSENGELDSKKRYNDESKPHKMNITLRYPNSEFVPIEETNNLVQNDQNGCTEKDLDIKNLELVQFFENVCDEILKVDDFIENNSLEYEISQENFNEIVTLNKENNLELKEIEGSEDELDYKVDIPISHTIIDSSHDKSMKEVNCDQLYTSPCRTPSPVVWNLREELYRYESFEKPKSYMNFDKSKSSHFSNNEKPNLNLEHDIRATPISSWVGSLKKYVAIPSPCLSHSICSEPSAFLKKFGSCTATKILHPDKPITSQPKSIFSPTMPISHINPYRLDLDLDINNMNMSHGQISNRSRLIVSDNLSISSLSPSQLSSMDRLDSEGDSAPMSDMEEEDADISTYYSYNLDLYNDNSPPGIREPPEGEDNPLPPMSKHFEYPRENKDWSWMQSNESISYDIKDSDFDTIHLLQQARDKLNLDISSGALLNEDSNQDKEILDSNESMQSLQNSSSFNLIYVDCNEQPSITVLSGESYECPEAINTCVSISQYSNPWNHTSEPNWDVFTENTKASWEGRDESFTYTEVNLDPSGSLTHVYSNWSLTSNDVYSSLTSNDILVTENLTTLTSTTTSMNNVEAFPSSQKNSCNSSFIELNQDCMDSMYEEFLSIESISSSLVSLDKTYEFEDGEMENLEYFQTEANFRGSHIEEYVNEDSSNTETEKDDNISQVKVSAPPENQGLNIEALLKLPHYDGYMNLPVTFSTAPSLQQIKNSDNDVNKSHDIKNLNKDCDTTISNDKSECQVLPIDDSVSINANVRVSLRKHIKRKKSGKRKLFISITLSLGTVFMIYFNFLLKHIFCYIRRPVRLNEITI